MIFAEFVDGDDSFMLRIDHVIVLKGRENVVIVTYNNYELHTTMSRQEVLSSMQKAAVNSRNNAGGLTIPTPNIGR